MSDPSMTPEPILQVCAGLWAAGALKSGVDLKLFDALAAGPQDITALSHALGAAPQSLRIVLDALVALGFVAQQAHGYTLTEVSSAFLVSSQPTYLGALVADNANSAAVFDVCKDYRRVVTEGYRLDPWAYSAGSNERVMHLTRNLFTLGYPAAQAIADHLGWTPGTPEALRLLDVGCGSAVYGVVALTRLPAARLTAQDWPVVLPVAQEFAAQLGVAERVQTLSGDLRTVEFGGPYDAVFLGHILHNYPEEICREILRKCLGVLAPGGCVIIIEFLAEPGRSESMFSWLFSVMIHGTRGGRSFSSAELRQMLTECGASRTEVGGGLPVGFVVGYRS
jgi:2-polyprenyl-3-methyl-5-hydroxy-6-metoxy-1,4-benzoquinol methylase